MDTQQLLQMRDGKGFIAALDQSGGSTPKALQSYGVAPTEYNSEAEMYECVHQMRTRMITAPAFSQGKIIGVILFERTMRSEIEGLPTADYLWDKLHIVPFLKVDKGLQELQNGTQLMKPFPELGQLCEDAVKHNIFGTKMRSVIKEANVEGIKAVVKQQFEWANLILSHGLVPIIEPEVDIHCPEKAEAERILKEELIVHLNVQKSPVMLKITLPTVANFYEEIVNHPMMIRVVALSGGYPREEADRLLTENHNIIASFSRALAESLSAKQSEEEFDAQLQKNIDTIYNASIT